MAEVYCETRRRCSESWTTLGLDALWIQCFELTNVSSDASYLIYGDAIWQKWDLSLIFERRMVDLRPLL